MVVLLKRMIAPQRHNAHYYHREGVFGQPNPRFGSGRDAANRRSKSCSKQAFRKSERFTLKML
jgi:hypothetical protein